MDILKRPKDMMFFKVTIALITICAADPQLLLSEHLSEQEVAPHALPFYEQIMFRMISKYAKVDERSTTRSKPRYIRSAIPNTMFRQLQYAPLRKGMNLYPTPTHRIPPVEPTEMFQYKQSRQYSKSNLEPRTEAIDMKCYDQGYNKKFKASASRSPGHNAAYRIIPKSKAKGKPITDYKKPIGINLDLDSLKSTTDMPLTDFSSDSKHMPLTIAQDDFVINPNSLETDLPMQDKSKRYSSNPKFRRLHLNIARVYSPGQVPPKVPAYARAYPEHFGRPPKPQVYRPKSFQDHSQNTMLYPVKHHRKGNYLVHPSIIHFK